MAIVFSLYNGLFQSKLLHFISTESVKIGSCQDGHARMDTSPSICEEKNYQNKHLVYNGLWSLLKGLNESTGKYAIIQSINRSERKKTRKKKDAKEKRRERKKTRKKKDAKEKKGGKRIHFFHHNDEMVQCRTERSSVITGDLKTSYFKHLTISLIT